MNRRIARALIVALAVQFALEQVMATFLNDIPASQAFTTLALWSSANTLLAMILGGFIARRGFTLPAVILQLAYYFAGFMLLAQMSGYQGGDGTFFVTAMQNWRLLGLGLLATVVGSIAGQRLASGRGQHYAS